MMFEFELFNLLLRQERFVPKMRHFLSFKYI